MLAGFGIEMDTQQQQLRCGCRAYLMNCGEWWLYYYYYASDDDDGLVGGEGCGIWGWWLRMYLSSCSFEMDSKVPLASRVVRDECINEWKEFLLRSSQWHKPPNRSFNSIRMVFASNVHFYVGHLHNPQFITSFVSTETQDRQTTRRAKYSHLHGAENICIFKGRLADWWMRGGGDDWRWNEGHEEDEWWTELWSRSVEWLRNYLSVTFLVALSLSLFSSSLLLASANFFYKESQSSLEHKIKIHIF